MISSTAQKYRLVHSLSCALLLGVCPTLRADPEDQSPPPANPPVVITTKVLSNNHALVQSGSFSSLRFIPTTTIGIKVVINESPEPGVIRFFLEGVDRDGFQIKKLIMPDLFVAQNGRSEVSREIAIHTNKLRRIVQWRMSDIAVVEDPTDITIQTIKTKVFKTHEGDELRLALVCENRLGEHTPNSIEIQGLDTDGYCVYSISLTKDSSIKWIEDGRQVQIEAAEKCLDEIKSVRKWRAIGNTDPLASIQRLTDGDFGVSVSD
jgi:hypothetical protein